MDEESYSYLQAQHFENMILVSHQELEASNELLANARLNRTKVEYYWTCGPSFIHYLLVRYSEIDLLTDLDADMFFFADLTQVFCEMEGRSVGIVEHRFSNRNRKRLKFGKYNVGFMCFRRDIHGMECAKWWSERCIEWCYDRLEGDRYGDQKYLDKWPELFKNVHIINHKGVNVAPWNIDNYQITDQAGNLMVDDMPLVCFHFHGFKEINPWLFDTKLGRSGISPSRIIRRKIFGEYLSALTTCSPDGVRTKSIRQPHLGVGFILRSLKWLVQVCSGIFSRSYIIVFRGRVL